MKNNQNVTKKILLHGLVQGVGFRPYVAELAEKFCLCGKVYNAGGEACIFITGEQKTVERWFHRLFHKPPKGAVIYDWSEVPLTKEEEAELSSMREFKIVESEALPTEPVRFLPPDVGTCPDCREELLDPKNRRYRYPFISCVTCGPRISIMKKTPYDREHTTMASFPLCEACQEEYEKSGDIRRYAQTIACAHCGPKLVGINPDGSTITETKDEGDLTNDKDNGEEILKKGVEILKKGGVIALKGVGGYHLCADALKTQGAGEIRNYKMRENKPFAVLFANVEDVREYAEVSREAEDLLKSPARPIVLLPKKEQGKRLGEGVLGNSSRIGAMLPSHPLQILLLQEVSPLIMTSCNRGGEPLVTGEEEVRKVLQDGGAAYAIGHDRKIRMPLDDSIFQEKGGIQGNPGKFQIIRRARGMVPEPVLLPKSLDRPVIAQGGDLKAVFALGYGKAAYLSGHFGDLEDEKARNSRIAGMKAFYKLYEVQPVESVEDLHPGYYAKMSEGTECKRSHAQHHVAHIASVMAEHRLEDVLGIALDGTGYGPDHSVWGGEVLHVTRNGWKRVGSLEPVLLPGGDQAAKDGNLVLFSYLAHGLERGYLNREDILPEHEYGVTLALAANANQVNRIRSTSTGRLFDGVSCALEISKRNSYEGESAQMLEDAARAGLRDNSELHQDLINKYNLLNQHFIEKGEVPFLRTANLLCFIYLQMSLGYKKEVLAAFFHKMLAKGVVFLSQEVGRDKKIALSGGTWYNQVLTNEVYREFEKMGQREEDIFMNELVPAGDGGLALGQLWLNAYQVPSEESLEC